MSRQHVTVVTSGADAPDLAMLEDLASSTLSWAQGRAAIVLQIEPGATPRRAILALRGLQKIVHVASKAPVPLSPPAAPAPAPRDCGDPACRAHVRTARAPHAVAAPGEVLTRIALDLRICRHIANCADPECEIRLAALRGAR